MDKKLSINQDESRIEGVKNNLLIRALNYHGQQLTSLIKDEPIFRELDLKNVDYHLYQTRCAELRMEDRGYRLDLHRFIASNMKQIFRDDKTMRSNTISSTKPVEKWGDNESIAQRSGDVGDLVNKESQKMLSANMPPYELFASDIIDKEDRLRHVFEILSVNDVIYCRVTALNASGLLMNVCCFAGLSLDKNLDEDAIRKSRYMEDLKIKCFCTADELLGASETLSKEKGRVRSYQTGDFVCVVIIEVKRDVQRLLVSMKYSALSDPGYAEEACKSHEIRLGLVSSGVPNLPLTYQKTLQVNDKKPA